jgi:hypothetical protein
MVSVQGGPELALPILEYRVKQTGDLTILRIKLDSKTFDSLSNENKFRKMMSTNNTIFVNSLKNENYCLPPWCK